MGQIYIFQQTNKHLGTLLESFGMNLTSEGCEGIQGVIKAGLKLVDKYKDDRNQDMALVHSLMFIHYYKLGLYKIIANYFQACNQETDEFLIQQCARE